MKKMNAQVPARKRQQGASMIEYAIVVTLVVLAAVLGLTTLGGNLGTKFTNIATEVAK